MFSPLQHRRFSPTSGFLSKDIPRLLIRRGLRVLAGLALAVACSAPRVALSQGSSPPQIWTAAAPYPMTISLYGFTQVGEDFYVISGLSTERVVTAVRRYNAITDAWTTLADIPVGSAEPTAAHFDGKIYVLAIGGIRQNGFQIYDIATNSWSAGPPIPERSDTPGAATGAFNGNVYIAGGLDSSRGDLGTTLVSIYNIATNTWSTGPAAPATYFRGGYTQVGQFLYMVGGNANKTGFANSTVSMRLDMATNRWSLGPGYKHRPPHYTAGAWTASPHNLPSPRQGNHAGFFSTGRTGGEIWSTGGIGPGFVILSEHLFRPDSPRPPSFIISEFRARGPNGDNDEFIEIHNNTAANQVVIAADGSGGYAVATQDGVVRCILPHGTMIRAKGHFLCTNSNGYSLNAYTTGNSTYAQDIGDTQGVALFSTSNPANFTLDNRLDAFGYTSSPPLYREGTGIQNLTIPAGGITGQISFHRNLSAAGTAQDTGDNAADFIFTNTIFTETLGSAPLLGAPGPGNLDGPTHNKNVFVDRLGMTQSVSNPPNRVRDLTPVTNGTQGTLSFRRRVTNYTGQTVTRLRFRIRQITTAPAPAGVADLRALSSGDITVNELPVRGTAVEEPPTQPNGGGWNTSWSVDLATPLAPGATINVQYVVGVMQGGSFSIFINVEALP